MDVLIKGFWVLWVIAATQSRDYLMTQSPGLLNFELHFDILDVLGHVNLKAGAEGLKFPRTSFHACSPAHILSSLRRVSCLAICLVLRRHDIHASNCKGLLGFLLQIGDLCFGLLLDKGSGLWHHVSLCLSILIVLSWPGVCVCASMPACPYVSSVSSHPDLLIHAH